MTRRIITLIIALMTACSMLVFTSCTQDKPPVTNDSVDLYELNEWDFTLTQLSGQDSLGRKVLPTGDYIRDKYVGVYFMPWFGESVNNTYDISKILDEYENDVVGNPENPLWAISGEYYDDDVSPNGAFHYWNEPLWGYYRSSDKWVIARQLEIMAYAQIDFIMMDFTNGFVYDEATYAILDVIKEFVDNGNITPKMAFMLPNNTMSASTLEKIVTKFISKEEYRECFFVADPIMNPSGKPLVTLCITGLENDPNMNYIWPKQMFWAGSPKDESYFPAGDTNVVQTNFNGMMGVNVAINTSWFSDCYLYPDATTVYGRGWNIDDPWGQGTDRDKVLSGAFFEMQWQKALDEDVDLVFISCWNELAAQKQTALQNDYAPVRKAVFVDTFSPEFSKDCEPVKGFLGDNYYMQLLEKTREFKHKTAESAVKHEKATIDITDLSAWSGVKGNYLDVAGDARARDCQSVKNGLKYTDNTNRNDIVRLKLANDDENLYVMVETRANVTAYESGDNSWMNLFVSTGKNAGWNGYDYAINTAPNGNATNVLKYNGSEWVDAGSASYFLFGNRIVFSIKLSTLGVTSGSQLGIKAADNIPFAQDVMNFYLGGDSAPIGRLNYGYEVA